MFELWYWVFSLLFIVSIVWYAVLSVGHLRQLRRLYAGKDQAQKN
ncbi:MAG: hypothetical protein ACOH5I_16130 [Oligoflexus sp.]